MVTEPNNVQNDTPTPTVEPPLVDNKTRIAQLKAQIQARLASQPLLSTTNEYV